jgi:hypothetical protein
VQELLDVLGIHQRVLQFPEGSSGFCYHSLPSTRRGALKRPRAFGPEP